MTNTCSMPNQSYCAWMAANSAVITRMPGMALCSDLTQPRNRKPRKMISSVTGAAMTKVSHNSGSVPPSRALRSGVDLERRNDVATEQIGQPS